MPNQKRKSENYNSFGGINTKISSYMNTPLEFLDIVNFDFQTPGALTQVWGSTQYVGQTFPGRINTLVEFNKLDGSSYVIIGHSGGLWSGATTGNSQGLSFTLFGATYLYPINIPFWQGSTTTGGTTISPKGSFKDTVAYQGDPSSRIANGISSVVSATTINSAYIVNPLLNGRNKFSVAAAQDWLFMADGEKFIKFNGSTTYPVGLPPPIGATMINAIRLDPLTIIKDNEVVGLSGVYCFYGSFTNNRGFQSPIWPIGVFSGGETVVSGSSAWTTFGAVYSNSEYFGIEKFNTYSYFQPTVSNWATLGAQMWNYPYRQIKTVDVAPGSTITDFRLGWGGPLGATLGGISAMMNNLGSIPDPKFNDYVPIGFGVSVGNLITGYVDTFNFNKYAPRYLEVYKERVFAAGFSGALSTVAFSDVAEPEGYPSENNFEVRTNDSDYITALKNFKSALVIFKKNSFHALTGDNINNLVVQELSTQYGCVNHWSTAQFNNTLVFLDRKGVMAWSGSSLENISTKVQPIFDRMNYNAALNEACMVHDKLRNQVVVSFPIDGATLNNFVMAFDYNTGAWTRHDGYAPSVLSSIQGRNFTQNMFYGSHSGVVNWSGASFLAHNGVGFTTYFKSRFLHEIGESYTKMHRRLFMNIDAPGTTLQFGINFFQDYGASKVLQTTMVISQFQQRIDFGIGAKALAFEMSSLQTAVPLKVNGFTIESRKLRDV